MVLVLRIKREHNELKRNLSKYWSLIPKGDNLMIWEGKIHNLDDARHFGKDYSLEIILSENHPFSPPKIRFTTMINCDHVYPQGEVCMDILDNQWSPIFTLEKLMMSLCSLLTDRPVTGYMAKYR